MPFNAGRLSVILSIVAPACVVACAGRQQRVEAPSTGLQEATASHERPSEVSPALEAPSIDAAANGSDADGRDAKDGRAHQRLTIAELFLAEEDPHPLHPPSLDSHGNLPLWRPRERNPAAIVLNGQSYPVPPGEQAIVLPAPPYATTDILKIARHFPIESSVGPATLRRCGIEDYFMTDKVKENRAGAYCYASNACLAADDPWLLKKLFKYRSTIGCIFEGPTAQLDKPTGTNVCCYLGNATGRNGDGDHLLGKGRPLIVRGEPRVAEVRAVLSTSWA